MRRELFAAVGVALVVSAVTWAQTTTKVDQGKPGTQGPWPITCVSGCSGGSGGSGGAVTGPDGGSVFVHFQIPECSRIVQTNDAGIGTSPQRVPGTGTAGRTWVRICNHLLNASSTQCICSAMDCPASVAVGAVGDILATGDCVTYGIGVLDGGVPCCVCNGANSFLPATECIP